MSAAANAALAARLLAALPGDIRVVVEAEAGGAAGWILARLGEAHAAWPGLSAHDEAFVTYLAEKIVALPEPAAFHALRVGDLYLTHACLATDVRALSLFEEAFLPRVDRQLARLRLDAAALEDVTSELREQLYFGKETGRPLLADYRGRGDLASWLRSIAIRTAGKVQKRERRSVEYDDELDPVVVATDPDLELLRRKYAPRFKTALTHALDALPARDRNLLRQHYIDALSIDAVASLYRVHRATAARWLAGVRAAVLRQVAEELRATAALSDSELESLLRTLATDPGPSMSRLLINGS